MSRLNENSTEVIDAMWFLAIEWMNIDFNQILSIHVCYYYARAIRLNRMPHLKCMVSLRVRGGCCQ